MWSGKLKDGQVCGVEVVEAGLVQAIEHVLLHGIPWHAKEGTDEGRAEGLGLPARVRKAT